VGSWIVYWIIELVILVFLAIGKPSIFIPAGIVLLISGLISKEAFLIANGLFVLFLFVLAVIYFGRQYKSIKSTDNDSTLTYDNSRWIDVTKAESPLLNTSPQIDTTEDLTIKCIKQFKPRWINRDGKPRLEGGENGNNANLAQHLRDNNIPHVETEIYLKNGSRADLMINNQIIIECKPNLLRTDKLHSISGELRRVKRIGNYKVYALIYGDAKSYLLDDLKADIGENNVIVLGEVNTN
jgi:hypothetical protein